MIEKSAPRKTSVRLASWLMAFTAMVLAILLLTKATVVGESVMNGLALCANVVIPSLFCFFILTSFITYSGLNRILSLPFSPISRYLFHLDKSLGCVVIMSLIGGYPIGAKIIAGLLEEKAISLATAKRLLCFCCCAGPSFVITAVGTHMFSSAKTGIALYSIQVICSLICGVAASFGCNAEKISNNPCRSVSYGEAFVRAVNSSVTVMAQMCGYILFFNALLPLLNTASSCTAVKLVCILLEVTTGCQTAAAIPGIWGPVAVSFLLSFGGVSVLCQIAGILKDTGIGMKKMIAFRLAHGLLSSAMMFFYVRMNPELISAFASAGAVPISGSNTPMFTLCLLVMCSILLMCSGKFEKFLQNR